MLYLSQLSLGINEPLSLGTQRSARKTSYTSLHLHPHPPTLRRVQDGRQNRGNKLYSKCPLQKLFRPAMTVLQCTYSLQEHSAERERGGRERYVYGIISTRGTCYFLNVYILFDTVPISTLTKDSYRLRLTVTITLTTSNYYYYYCPLQKLFQPAMTFLQCSYLTYSLQEHSGPGSRRKRKVCKCTNEGTQVFSRIISINEGNTLLQP